MKSEKAPKVNPTRNRPKGTGWPAAFIFMEHIIKQSETETIKRFELNGKNIWVIRQGNNWGIGGTKKEAEKLGNKQYAQEGIPGFITEIGSTNKLNTKPEVWSIPSAVNFIWQLTPVSWHARYFFRTIADQNSAGIFLEIALALVPEMEPLRYYSHDAQGPHQAIQNCLYQFYLDREKNVTTKKQHPKLAEWQKNWYSKLTPRKIL